MVPQRGNLTRLNSGNTFLWWIHWHETCPGVSLAPNFDLCFFRCRWWYPNKDSWHWTGHLFATGTWAIVHGIELSTLPVLWDKVKGETALASFWVSRWIHPAAQNLLMSVWVLKCGHIDVTLLCLSLTGLRLSQVPGARLKFISAPRFFPSVLRNRHVFPPWHRGCAPWFDPPLIRAGALRDRPLGAELLGKMCNIVLFVPKAYTS